MPELDEMSNLPLVDPSHFEGRNLKMDGKILVFFYAKWCPYSRSACKETECIAGGNSYTSYAADLSDDDNPLWEELGIEVVPTLIGYRDGEEIYRKPGARMMGLRRADLEAANSSFEEA